MIGKKAPFYRPKAGFLAQRVHDGDRIEGTFPIVEGYLIFVPRPGTIPKRHSAVCPTAWDKSKGPPNFCPRPWDKLKKA